MKNPIKEARLRRGISQRELAGLAGMSAQAVMRYEQGLYENLSDKLATATAELDSQPVGEVIRDYALYRDFVQREASLAVVPPAELRHGEHPFTTFERNLMRSKGKRPSRISFCILLAIHPATVAEYDMGKVKHMPALIERALINAGMHNEDIETLKTFGELYYERNN